MIKKVDKSGLCANLAMITLAGLITACGGDSTDSPNASPVNSQKQTVGSADYIPVIPKGQVVGKALDNETNPHMNNAGDTGVFIEGNRVTLSPFYMGETEVTYKLYKEVYNWGKANGYEFTVAQDCIYNMNTYGYDCTPAPDKEPFQRGGNAFTADNNYSYDATKHSDDEPVTQVSWRDAIIWANAYTEMTQDSDIEAVYRKSPTDDTVLKSSTEKNEQGFVVDWAFPQLNKKGFRLPTEAEWEYAARYQGTDATNAVQYGDIWLTKLWSLSGMTDRIAHDNMTLEEKTDTTLMQQLEAEANRVAAFNERYTGAEFKWTANTDPKTLPVKSKAPNALGLYDMSGNVAEFCFDGFGTEHLVGDSKDPQGPLPSSGFGMEKRVKRGGHWNAKAEDSLVGFRHSVTPKYRSDYEGFRVAFSK